MASQEVELVQIQTVSSRLSKRAFWDRMQHILDVIVIFITAPIWMPVLIAAMVAKRIIEGPTVLFEHMRVGLHGRTFTLYKIRTTVAQYQAHPEDWPDENYPPRTRFGTLLRRCDLDELPQLWNVLKGEMSLVGPRPETPYHTARFRVALPGYEERWLVRPGITGLAQLRRLRGNTDVSERLLADLEYISARGWRMYVSILFGTIWLEVRQALGA
jgi:lipopolysaccharide/colanic/teichoic acid biosynthesis glycosyltransferase